MSTNLVQSSLRAVLCAGLSVAALSMAQPAQAGDLDTPFVKAAPRGETRLWAEGGVFFTGGDRIQFASGDPFFGGKGRTIDGPFPPEGVFPPCFFNNCQLRADPSVKPWIGVDAGAGFDHRFAGTRWHVNGEWRGGVGFGKKSYTDAFSFTDGTDSFVFNSPVEAKLLEWHWHADLGMGYDIISGRTPLQIKFGLRVAEVGALNKITTNTTFSFSDGTDTVNATINDVTKDRRSFLGAGPRLGMQGEIPLFGAWTFDYQGDAAVLFGNTKIASESATSFAITSSTGTAVSGAFNSNNEYWTKAIYVWNFDMQAGFGYWITPNWKATIAYRLDVFLDPLRQFRDDTLPAQSIDRYYHGVKVGLLGRWN